jgi:hypothetical protein
MKLSEIINEVIPLATKIHEYWDRELPKRHPNYPLVNPGEDSGPPPPEQKQLEDLLAGLPEEIIYQLALVTESAIGSVTIDGLPKRYQEVKQRFGTPELTAFLLANKMSWDEYLMEDLAEFERRGIDVDNLPLQSGISATP